MVEHTSDVITGDMEIGQQVTTFHHFLKFTKWASLAIAVMVLTTTIWFCTDSGFLAGAVSGLVVLVLGILLLREKHPGRTGH